MRTRDRRLHRDAIKYQNSQQPRKVSIAEAILHVKKRREADKCL